jgi:hypothetical protein
MAVRPSLSCPYGYKINRGINAQVSARIVGPASWPRPAERSVPVGAAGDLDIPRSSAGAGRARF